MAHIQLGPCPFCNHSVSSAHLVSTDRIRCPNRQCRKEVSIGDTQQHAKQKAEADKRRRQEDETRQKERASEQRALELEKERKRIAWKTIVEMEHKGHVLIHRQSTEYLPFQKDGICFLMDNPASLLADDMGLGKTIQAIGLINSLDLDRVLIICPATLKKNWETELNKWLTRFRNRQITIVNASEANLRGTILIINYEILHRFVDELADRKWDLIVADESQRVKNPEAKRTKAFLNLDAPRRVLMTGTPILNRPGELWTSLHWLAPKEWADQRDFEARYCAAHDGGWGYNSRGASNLGELNRRLSSSVMLRRKKKDVLKDLPPKFRQVIKLPCEDREVLEWEIGLCKRLEGERTRLRQAAEKARLLGNDEEYRRALDELRKFRITRLGEIAKARHKTALHKIPDVVEHLKSAVEDTGKVICFAYHRDVVEQICDHFPGESVMHYGDMTERAKQASVDDFQAKPEITLFVGNILSAGEGLTLTASSNVVFAELDWTPARLTQCEDRAHRIGQHDNVLVQHLVIDGSLDSMIAEKLVEKQIIIEKAIDGGSRDLDVDDVLGEFVRGYA